MAQGNPQGKSIIYFELGEGYPAGRLSLIDFNEKAQLYC
jgi:hypothetical protein